MKAKEILEWICRESINGEYLNTIEVPAPDDGQDEEWWLGMFGGCPPQPIEGGCYLYFYLSSGFEPMEADPDAEIELMNTGTMFDYDYIYFYRIDD